MRPADQLVTEWLDTFRPDVHLAGVRLTEAFVATLCSKEACYVCIPLRTRIGHASLPRGGHVVELSAYQLQTRNSTEQEGNECRVSRKSISAT